EAIPGLHPSPYQPLAFGVIWPSKAWDESAEMSLERVGMTVPDPHASSMVEAVYEALSPEKASAAGFRHDVLRMQQFLVKDRLEGNECNEFRTLLRCHADQPTLVEDQSIFEPEAPIEALEGITSGDFSARSIFRTFTYWQMKKRAGIVGGAGVRVAI